MHTWSSTDHNWPSSNHNWPSVCGNWPSSSHEFNMWSRLLANTMGDPSPMTPPSDAARWNQLSRNVKQLMFLREIWLVAPMVDGYRAITKIHPLMIGDTVLFPDQSISVRLLHRIWMHLLQKWSVCIMGSGGMFSKMQRSFCFWMISLLLPVDDFWFAHIHGSLWASKQSNDSARHMGKQVIPLIQCCNILGDCLSRPELLMSMSEVDPLVELFQWIVSPWMWQKAVYNAEFPSPFSQGFLC